MATRKDADKSEESPAEKDLRRVTASAERLKLKGKEKATYIHEHMTGFGYKPQTSYIHPDDDDDENDSGGRFGLGRRNSNRTDDDDDDF
jgi:hypothetical protein